MGDARAAYQFVSQPRAVETRRQPKYRDRLEVEEELGQTANMMFDPRIMRGIPNTRPMAATLVLDHRHKVPSRAQIRAVERKHKLKLVAAGKIRPVQQTVAQIHDGIVVEKKRVEVPLHLYLEEQKEEVELNTETTQTDAFLEEAPPPAYIPRKTGVDVETQVENAEVFQFARDVACILEVVISKTLEQGLLEVRHEQELKHLDKWKDRLSEKQAIREADAAAKVAAEKARTAAKNKVLNAGREKRAQQEHVARKVESMEFTAKYLEHLQQQVFDSLENKGWFFDPAHKQAEDLMPWLGKQVQNRLKLLEDASSSVDEGTREAADKIEFDKHQAAKWRAARDAQEAEARRLAREEEDERRRRSRYVQIWLEVKGEGMQQFNIKKKKFGPFLVRADAYTKLLHKKFLQAVNAVADEGALPYNFPDKITILHPDPLVHVDATVSEEEKEGIVHDEGEQHNDLVITKKRVGVVGFEACLYDAGVTTVDRCVANGSPETEDGISLTVDIDEVLELV